MMSPGFRAASLAGLLSRISIYRLEACRAPAAGPLSGIVPAASAGLSTAAASEAATRQQAINPLTSTARIVPGSDPCHLADLPDIIFTGLLQNLWTRALAPNDQGARHYLCDR